VQRFAISVGRSQSESHFVFINQHPGNYPDQKADPADIYRTPYQRRNVTATPLGGSTMFTSAASPGRVLKIWLDLDPIQLFSAHRFPSRG
jgi:hypothetical protein